MRAGGVSSAPDPAQADAPPHDGRRGRGRMAIRDRPRRALADHEVETILAILGPAPTADALADAVTIRGLRVVITGLPLDWTAASPGEIAETALAVAELADSAGADVVHLGNPRSPPMRSSRRRWLVVTSVSRPGGRRCARGRFPTISHGARRCWRAGMAPRCADRAHDRLCADDRRRIRHSGTANGAERPQTAICDADGRPGGGLVFTAGRLWDEGKNGSRPRRGAPDLPVLAAGPLERTERRGDRTVAYQALGPLGEAEYRRWLAADRSSRPCRATSPSALQCSKPPRPAARSCSDIPTLRELWDGAAVFVDPPDEAAIAAASMVSSRPAPVAARQCRARALAPLHRRNMASGHD